MKSVAVVLCLWILQQAHSVPSTLQSSCNAELVRVKRGDALALHCGSHCPESSDRQQHVFVWWKVSENGEREKLSFAGVAVTEDGVTEESGGEYECRCGNDGKVCTFYVAILPEVTFTSSRSATHYGDIVTLTCMVEGFPTNSSVMTNSHAVRLQNQFKKKISLFRMEVVAVVQDVEEEDYICSVEIHYKGYLVAEEKHNLKLKLYNPPSILYTTEYVIHQESEFGTSGHLSCAVETSADTQSHVTWWANGKELQEGDKYRMSFSEMSKEVRLFQLAVEKVQQSDIGSYLCQLSSDYNTEESQEAWIKVDYRKESTRVGGSLYTGNHAAELHGDDVLTGDRSSEHRLQATSSLRTVAVLLCLTVVAGLGTWGVMVHRRKRKRSDGKKDGIIGRDEGPSSPRGSPLLQSQGTGLSSVSVFKRK